MSVWHVMPKLMGPSRPVGWLCTDDLGAIAARMFADPETGATRWWGSRPTCIDECRAIWRDVRGRTPRGFPMPVRLFERFATDLTTMWRWPRTEEFEISTEVTRRILPEALTVREWLSGRSRRRAETPRSDYGRREAAGSSVAADLIPSAESPRTPTSPAQGPRSANSLEGRWLYRGSSNYVSRFAAP